MDVSRASASVTEMQRHLIKQCLKKTVRFRTNFTTELDLVQQIIPNKTLVLEITEIPETLGHRFQDKAINRMAQQMQAQAQQMRMAQQMEAQAQQSSGTQSDIGYCERPLLEIIAELRYGFGIAPTLAHGQALSDIAKQLGLAEDPPEKNLKQRAHFLASHVGIRVCTNTHTHTQNMLAMTQQHSLYGSQGGGGLAAMYSEASPTQVQNTLAATTHLHSLSGSQGGGGMAPSFYASQSCPIRPSSPIVYVNPFVPIGMPTMPFSHLSPFIPSVYQGFRPSSPIMYLPPGHVQAAGEISALQMMLIQRMQQEENKFIFAGGRL